MFELYFVDDEHIDNYIAMSEMFPLALKNKEYKAACYISSAPMIFDKFKDNLSEMASPIDWMMDWENKYLPQQKETDQEYQERSDIEINYDLTESMQQLGKLALNLWNGYEHFNLMHCLNSVDDAGFLIVKQAIYIRKGIANTWI